MTVVDRDLLDDVYARLDDGLDAALAVLSEHVAQPSVSSTGEGIRAAAERLRGFVAECGLAGEVVETAGHPVVVGHRPGPPGAPRLTFYGHYDVQPAAVADGWTSAPFTPTLRDGRLYGRGSADNKGQHLSVLHGLQALLAARPDLPVDLSVVIDGEEEITSPSLGPVLAAHRVAVGSDLVVATDGAKHRSGAPTVVRGCRGLVYVEVEATGAERELHGGTYGGAVPNAASRLVAALASLHDTDGRVAVAGFPDSGADPGLPALRPHLGIAGLGGGFQGQGMKTVVPHRAQAKVECRLVPGQSAREVGAAVVAHLERFAGVSARVIGATDPYRCAADEPWLAEVVAAVGRAGRAEPEVVTSLGGTLPLAALADGLGAPVLLVPLAGADQNNHGVDENVRVDDYRYGMRAAAAIAAAVAAAAARSEEER
ncbi:M20/M25/M40 family metallo-hydrolase [Nocardioides sp. LHD-245]|uniref:M20/M25/M40 family metallo-hydrolase n=1 Tax=Nocardioides sp. LHD-245 TaxID=3051387 RepID=UPI0027E1078F|nr:M20/M25/M40 family metallo-hydrolase [Nocardioides sp. LHD-245]